MEQYVKRCVNQIKNFHLDLTYAQKGLKPNSIYHHLTILERQATQQVNNNVAKFDDTQDFQKHLTNCTLISIIRCGSVQKELYKNAGRLHV